MVEVKTFKMCLWVIDWAIYYPEIYPREIIVFFHESLSTEMSTQVLFLIVKNQTVQ